MRKIIPDERARQGPQGRPILLVLVASFILVGLYLVALMIWAGSESPTHPTQDASRQAVSPSASDGSRTPPANPAYPAPPGPATTGSTTR
jgi:hypothetical protein